MKKYRNPTPHTYLKGKFLQKIRKKRITLNFVDKFFLDFPQRWLYSVAKIF